MYQKFTIIVKYIHTLENKQEMKERKKTTSKILAENGKILLSTISLNNMMLHKQINITTHEDEATIALSIEKQTQIQTNTYRILKDIKQFLNIEAYLKIWIFFELWKYETVMFATSGNLIMTTLSKYIKMKK